MVFTAPVTNSVEEQQQLTRIPEKTKNVTTSGMHVWLPSRNLSLETPVEDLAYWTGKFVLKRGRWMAVSICPKLCRLYTLACCLKRYYEANGVHDVNPLITVDP